MLKKVGDSEEDEFSDSMEEMKAFFDRESRRAEEEEGMVSYDGDSNEFSSEEGEVDAFFKRRSSGGSGSEEEIIADQEERSEDGNISSESYGSYG